MNSLLNMDGPVMSFLNRLADLIWLNILTMLCCIPVVTAGASLTAMYYMTIKMVRREEGYIARGFWKSFRQNFRQATLIWLLVLLMLAVLAGDLFVIRFLLPELPKLFAIAAIAVGVAVLFTCVYVFPVLARFDNTVIQTIKNAFLMSVFYFPRTIVLLVIYLIPAALLVLVPAVFPLVFMLGISLPAYGASFLFVRIFKRFEPEETAAAE